MGVKNAFLGRLLASSDKFSDEQVAQTISLLIAHGVKHRASDIHIEPHERHVQVRYRMGNTLRSMHKLPLAALPAVIAQIKDMAGLRANEDHLPQEGQYATLVDEEQFEIQVHTMPVVGGEKAVLHIARKLSKPIGLAELGFWGQGLEHLQHTLSRTHGLIVVATPRRSGKSTTLHSMLQLVNIPAISIATVEDKIEYRMPGISQTQVRPGRGITFYDGLQAALSQDPNIVMISDIADKSTANAVVQAAAGGHLLLAGMHADTAVIALSRLQALSEEPFLLANAVRTIISQRLVRKLCPRCHESYAPGRDEIRELEKAFGLQATVRQRVHELEQQAAAAGIGGHAVHTTPSGITTLWRASEEGCEACNHTGYQGVVALVELLEAGDSVRDAVLQNSLPAHTRRVALKNGFIPMELDGFIKVLRAQTTATEVLRTLAV